MTKGNRFIFYVKDKGKLTVIQTSRCLQVDQSDSKVRPAKKWTAEFVILMGVVLFGTFVAGFVTELSLLPMRPFWISVYVTLGFIGTFLIFFGFMKQYN